MKTEDFKKIIRTLIQEELSKQLPAMIPKVLSEVLSNNVNNSTHALQEQQSNNIKEHKQYVKNSKLNDALNQTVIKIRNENSKLVDYSSKLSSEACDNVNINNQELENTINYKDLTENHAPAKPIVANITPVSEEQAKVLGKLNRDFRGLMRTIDEKRKNGNSMIGMGGISINSGNID